MSAVDPNGAGGLVVPGGGGASLSDATPQAPGTPAAGVGTSASRDDHVHLPTTAAQAGAIATSLLTANGDLITRDSGVPARLPVGAAKTVLRTNASGNGVEYAAPAEVVGGGLATLLGGEVAGTAIVSDGAGDATLTSAGVSAALAASTAAGALTALGGVPAPTLLATDAALPTATAALAGSVAYAEDSGRTYVCRKTGASTYAWADAATGVLAARIGPADGTGAVRGVTWTPGVGVWGQSGRTLAIGWESVAVPSGVRVLAQQINDGSARGWLLSMSTAAVVLYYYNGGGSANVTLASGLSTGAHSIAIAWVSTASLHVSIDGGAASTVALSGTPVASNASDGATLLQHPTSAAADGIQERVAWLRTWASTLDDATLALVSASPSTYRPGNASVAVEWGWDAGMQPMSALRHRLWGTASTGANALCPTAAGLSWRGQ